MPMTVPVIVLSDSRTMFKNTIHVPLEVVTAPTDVQIGAANTKLEELLNDEETLGQMRRLFIAMGLHSDQTMASY